MPNSVSVKTGTKVDTFLNHDISPRQNACVNYLIPAVFSVFLYIFLFAIDITVAFRHYKDENPVWCWLTLFFVCLPSLGSYIIIISSWELWPQMEGCGSENLRWFALKTIQHLGFPVWAMWRYAERIFWSIEAVISNNKQFVDEAIDLINAPRSIELYFFFQAFLQSLPQLLLQLNIIMRRSAQMEKPTADVQVVSLVLNLARLSATVAFYQRFKSQKLAGKQYPWFKPYKLPFDSNRDKIDSLIQREKSLLDPSSIVEESRRSSTSSGSFLQPVGLQQVEGPLRETSIVDGPPRRLYKSVDEPDFNIRRLREILVKGLPEDDFAGKLVAFCWWFCFLLARILAISAFAYFYRGAAFGIILGHFILIIALLLYDVKTDEVSGDKTLFFLFIGLIYIFCLIEFKIKFKKTKLVYYIFFGLVYLEDFVMCLIWWIHNIDELENEFWFRFLFIVILMCSIFSFTAMIFYFNINKPDKVIIAREIVAVSTTRSIRT